MIQITIGDFMDTKNVVVICPYCKKKQINNFSYVCKECYEAIPIVDRLLTNIKSRFGFFNSEDPWDY